MLSRTKLTIVVAALCCSVSVFAQRGAGGYGQAAASPGAMGGGMGGGGRPDGLYRGDRGGSQREDYRTSKPEDDNSGFWVAKAAILTPGNRVEYKFKLRKGETLLASATSDAFDPALAVEDSHHKDLATNDDREEGDQSPFLIFKAPQDGDYTLKVQSFRQVSGGKFTVKMRTFLATDIAFGSATHENVEASRSSAAQRVVFRFSAKKGKVYDVRPAVENVKFAKYGIALVRVLGPTGVAANDFTNIPTGSEFSTIKALADGDVYLEYGALGGSNYTTDVREVEVTQGKPTSVHTLTMESDELKIIEFPVKPKQIIRTTVDGSAFLFVSSPVPVNAGSNAGDDPAYGDEPAWTWFKMNLDSDSDIVRIFHGDGVARFAVRSTSKSAQKVTLNIKESLPSWDASTSVKGSLAIGDSRIFLVKSTKSELMRVYAGATHFQPKLDIFKLTGELANTLTDRKTHTAKDDLYFPDEETYLVRLTCEGHGGSGDFEMKRESIGTTAYTLGDTETLNLDGVNFGLYSVNLEAGKRYQLTTDEPGKTLRADLLDDDGQFLTSKSVQFDKVEVQWFVPTRSGRHRLWLRGEPGVRHFKFELHVPPKIGG